MAEADKKEDRPAALMPVAPGPHIGAGRTTRGVMIDVLLGLVPVFAAACWVFGWYAPLQVGICVASCLAAEALFTAMRRRPVTLGDFSAVVTGVILGLSMPWRCPVHVDVVASFMAIGVGKVIFGGLGHNIFNPAMVGRAFVTIAFPALLGAGGYLYTGSGTPPTDVVTAATPMTVAKHLAAGKAGQVAGLWPLFLGNVNGSLGETSALACLVGGLYLCIRRTAAWQIPLGAVLAVAVIAGVGNLLHPQAQWTVLHHLFGGALLYGAFFIATDPVTSPLTPRGKFIFGAGMGALVMVIRTYSGYPEGVQFSVLLMNALVPLINRWTVPRPVGGPVPAPKAQA